MKVLRDRKYLIALLALLVVFAACKGESPTAPTAGGGTGGGGSVGGGTPPTGATITLTVSNANPLVNSTSVITATVSQNNNPVPNGTAVEFQTAGAGGAPFGVWQDTGLATTIRTTTNGVATATLTSGTPGTAVVTAIVNNVTRQTTVVFQTTPTPPPTPNTAPTITSINPTSGKVTGGEILTLIGTNFRTPVRVLFDVGGGVVKEGFVSSVTATQIHVITPQVNIATGQTLDATVILLNEAGTPAETRVSAPGTFTYRLATLTPVVSTLSPDSGGIEGGTRITIFGSGFEAPVQVSFAPGSSGGSSGWSMMQVISITFSQIIAITPAARDVSANGSLPITGAVDLRVLNINSNTEVIKSVAYRYLAKNVITAITPSEGSFLGGTRMVIDGTGFDDPIAVSVAGRAAQVVKVAGTQVTVITSSIQPTGCSDITGPVVVTNVNNGDQATGPSFIYRVPKPLVVSVSNPTPLGGTITIRVLNALGIARLKLGTVGLNITSQLDNGDGTTTFTAIVPSTLVLQTKPCEGVVGVNHAIATAFDVTYTSALTTCTDTLVGGAIITPPATPVLTITPSTGFTPFTATITPAVVGPPAVGASVKPSVPQTITLVNSGAGPLTISSIDVPPGCVNFTVSAPTVPPSRILNECDSLPIVVIYNGTITSGSQTCTITVTTDAGVRTFTLLGTSQ